jgi:hypothetical protein
MKTGTDALQAFGWRLAENRLHGGNAKLISKRNFKQTDAVSPFPRS